MAFARDPLRMTSCEAWNSFSSAHQKVIEFEPLDPTMFPCGQTTDMFRTMSNCMVTAQDDLFSTVAVIQQPLGKLDNPTGTPFATQESE